ncbi:hypothetical protein TWF718_003024 [Orbilia javanica]|uniref:Uncharacterized protein n=1 Tax=Orbilia javanica TaxID=47235 RepID=A0AAN8RAJ2_9PEZI
MDLVLAALERPGARSSRAGSVRSGASSKASWKTARSRLSRKGPAASSRPGSASGSESSSSGGSESRGRRMSQTYLRKTTEVFEAFKMLPPSLQKIEMERKMGLWEKTSRGSSGVASKAKSGAKRLPDLDDEPPRSPDAFASEEPTAVLAFFESAYLPVGSFSIPRIDIRNPIIIDPLAPKIPPQPAKFLMVRELAELYHRSNTEDMARDTWARGGIVGEGMRRRFEREEAERGNPGMRRGFGSSDPIPFAPAPEVTPLELTANPQPQFKFLDLVQAAAPMRLLPSAATRPYDWAPTSAGDLSPCKTLPAIFWGVSNKEAVSVVFYLFPTPRNISYPVSVGVVEDKEIPNIAVNTVKYASQSLLKVYWSGYIDFSRPMIIPNSSIYRSPSLASADEKGFWELWKCLFKQPTFGGHQYGMTKETSAFENPLRLRRAFESSTSSSRKYTAQMALEKPPLHLKGTFTDSTNDSDSDDETVKGYDSEDEVDSDDNSMTTAMSGEPKDNASCSGSTEIYTDSVLSSGSELKEKPAVTNWLDSIFERPPTITLNLDSDSDSEITSPEHKPLAKEETREGKEPLKIVQVKEEGRAITKRHTFEDPEEYKGLDVDSDAIEGQKVEELSTFDKRILKLLNVTVGYGGQAYQIPSSHAAYLYNYPGVKDTKSFLDCYRKQCIREAQEEEIKEKGFTDLSSGPYMWDDEVHDLRMDKEFWINDVLKGFRKAYGMAPYEDREVRRNYSMVIQAKKHGRAKFPVPWIPAPVLEIIEKEKPAARINADGVSVSRSISDSSSSEDEALFGISKRGYSMNGLERLLTINRKETSPRREEGHVKAESKHLDPQDDPTESGKLEDPQKGDDTSEVLITVGLDSTLIDTLENKPTTEQTSANLKSHSFAEYTTGKDNPDVAVNEDKQNSVALTECEVNDGSKDNRVSGPTLAGIEHFKKSSLFIECSADDSDYDSDDDLEIPKPKSSWFTECNAHDDSDEDEDTPALSTQEDNNPPKPAFFIECNANDDSDGDIEAPKPKSPWFTECNANYDSDTEEDTPEPSIQQEHKSPKSPFFIECNANDDSDTEEDIPRLSTQEEDKIPKSSFFIECNANDDSDDDPEVSTLSLPTECTTTNDHRDDESTKSPVAQEENVVPEPSISTECGTTKDTENTQGPTTLECDDTIASLQLLVTESDGNDSDKNRGIGNLVTYGEDKIPDSALLSSLNEGKDKADEDTQRLDEGGDDDDVVDVHTNIPKSSFFIECNAYDDSDDEDAQALATRKAFARRNLYNNETRTPLPEEPSAPPRNDQPPSSSPDAGHEVNRSPSESGSSRAITRAELRAMRRTRMDKVGVVTGDARSNAPGRRFGSFLQQLGDTSNLQLRSQEQKAVKKPGKIRIPDAFLRDRHTPARNPDPPVPTREQLSTISETDTEATSTPRQARQHSRVQRTEGETNWSAQMREEGLKRRFESRRRRPDEPF